MVINNSVLQLTCRQWNHTEVDQQSTSVYERQ